MSDLTKAEQFALGAVARHFSASWLKGDGAAAAYITVGVRRIALDVAVLVQVCPTGKSVPKARLREDAVALRVLREIESALSARVPKGKTIVLTLGAPIKVPRKLIAVLTRTLLAYLESGAVETDEKRTMLGNRVRFRVLNDRKKWNAKVLAFVFSGDPLPGLLATAMRALHDEIAAKAKSKKIAGERWLVLGSDNCIADFKTYQRAYSCLTTPHPYRKILMVYAGERVETLTES
jgi:hypothetical protein